MIIEVTESNYKGILIERVKDKGWKCNLGGQEYLFPYYTAAQVAIDEIFADTTPIIKNRQGKKFGKKSEVQIMNPQCEGCEQLAKVSEIVKNHMEWENDYFTAILTSLELQKDSLQDKDYQQVEKLLDELIAELKA